MKMSHEDAAVFKEALALMRKLEPDPEHVLQVRRIGIALWRGSHSLHKLAPRFLALFEASALLHDIGWSHSPKDQAHHKHSAELILKHPWKSLAPEEIRIVAQTARYHRKGLPSLSHVQFRALSIKSRHVAQANAALLRIADSLDRSHRQAIQKARISKAETGWVVTVLTTEPLRAETYGFEKKKDLFERHFKTCIRLNPLKTDSLPDCPVLS
ncbi:MAG: HD domain-containing protein [Methylacidiphilales bacterium]|nr:HD domain-containing protein [Candidatus Methylacidiphilales bacterium]